MYEAFPVIPLNIFNKDENAIYVLLEGYFGEYGNVLYPGNVQYYVGMSFTTICVTTIT